MSDTSIRVLKDIAYKTPDTPDIAPSSNTLDLYLPAVSANPSTTPLLVYIHGGLWLDRDKREYAQLASAFAAKNMAVAVINYRLSLDTITATRVHPAHTKDCADAIKWLAAHASEFGYSSKQVLMGHSCGATMAGLLALDPSFLGELHGVVTGVVAIQGLYDLPAYGVEAPQWRPYIERSMTADESVWRSASPALLSAPDPSRPLADWLIIHSPKDQYVSLKQPQLMETTLKRLGAKYSTMYDPLGDHFGVVLSMPAQLQERIVAFAREHMK